MASEHPMTYRALVAAFTEFMTIAIHIILYERQIYPQTSFLTARRYNIAVRQNRHPKVCEWINDAVSALETQLLKCAVDRVAIVLYNKANVALERFVFDVSPLPIISETDLDLPLVQEDNAEAQDLPIVDMEEQFRAIISKLGSSASSLKTLPPGCTFTVAIELRDNDSHAPVSHPQAWIPVLPNASDKTPQSSTGSSKAGRSIPIRAMSAGELAFDAWIEESKAKLSSAADTSKSSSVAS